jgi:DNA mismatch repair protein MSH5
VLEDTEDTGHFDLTRNGFVRSPCERRIILTLFYLVLEQTRPDVVLTSSKSDDKFIDTLREHGNRFHRPSMRIYSLLTTADTSGGIFQIRPFKEFTPAKGRDRLCSLQLFSDLPVEDAETTSSESGSKPSNAYEFFAKRKGMAGDPTTKRWNAGIRLSNFAAIDTAPTCVSYPLT